MSVVTHRFGDDGCIENDGFWWNVIPNKNARIDAAATLKTVVLNFAFIINSSSIQPVLLARDIPMSTVTEQILTKLNHIESISEAALTLVLDFVSDLESKVQNSKVEISETAQRPDNTATFLLGLAESFADGLTEEELAALPEDGAKNHDEYLYKS